MDVVFAETSGKAKSIARYTNACCDCDFIDIRVRRVQEADSRYDGKSYKMDWDNPDDRVFLVKELGFYCEDFESAICYNCVANRYCDTFKNYLEWQREIHR